MINQILTIVHMKVGVKMAKLYYALYKDSEHVLVFPDKNERDSFVRDESIIHPDCVRASKGRVKDLVRDRTPIYEDSFGCLAILATI